ncbi:hypothetical protein [Serratia marcescens]|uniref:hypothetical protein n=1 Tax=Serratia marcescens TaxID=615 RepID=UPI0009A619EA|nr:hypothetical protein [Serratia marcescens]
MYLSRIQFAAYSRHKLFLSIWLERISLRTHSNGEEDLIGAIMSLLQGVPEMMEGADEVLAGVIMQELAGKKS